MIWINKIRNERKEIAVHTTGAPRTKTEYYEQLQVNRSENLEEMDKFLESYNLPRPNLEEIENLNRLVTNTEIETNIKTSPKEKKKIEEQMTSKVNSTKHSKN